MRALSASEAIGPAFERAKELLFVPFRWRTFLKIAAVAFFAEIGGGVNLNVPGRGSNIHSLPPAWLAFIIAFAVIIGLISLVIGLLLFYLGSRLQLVLLELVATHQTLVGPPWRRVGQPTWRWIGLKLAFFAVAALLSLLLALPLILYFVSHGSGFARLSNFGTLFHLHLALVLLFFAGALMVLIVIGVAYTLLRDLALPYIALEDQSISESLYRLRYMLGAEPGAVAVFVLLRILLVFVFGIMGEICIVVAVLLSLIPFAIAGGVLWFVLHNAGPAGTVVLIAFAVTGAGLFLAWIICLCIAVFGSIYTFSQAYALYFLGGRYPLLGDLLDRSTPPPSYPYPAAFPPFPQHAPPSGPLPLG